MQALNDLSVGQSITFRIKKSELSNFEKEDGGVEIVSLKSGKKEIITLESYNKHSRKMQKQAVAGFFAGGSICLAIAVFFLLWHKEIIGRPKHEIQSYIINRGVEYEKNFPSSLALILGSVGCKSSKQLVVHMLNIGQGDGIIIELPNDQLMLIDGGAVSAERDDSCRPDKGYNTNCFDKFTRIKDYMKKLKRTTIDYYLATHLHDDHIGVTPQVLAEFEVKAAYIPYYSSVGDSNLTAFLAAIKKHNIPLYPVNAGLKLINDSSLNLVLEFLSPNCQTTNTNYDTNGSFEQSCIIPEYEVVSGDQNSYSAVFMLTYGKKKLLFSGDMTNRTYNSITTQYSKSALKADLYKIAHHGSSFDNTNSPTWIKTIMPEYTIVSAGYGNPYSHPGKALPAYFLEHANMPEKNYFQTDHGEAEKPILRAQNMFFYQKDLDRLNAAYLGNHSNFFLLHSLPGVGKSKLLEMFAADKKCFYFSARKAINNLELANKELNQDFLNWRDLLENQLENSTKSVIIIDNYDYILRHDEQLNQQLLDFYLDYQSRNITIILSISLPYNYQKVIDDVSELLLDNLKTVVLDPLNYRQMKRLYPSLSAQDIILILALSGGVYRYLQYFDWRDGVNLEEVFAQNMRLIANEVEVLLLNDLRDLSTYNIFLELMAKNVRVLNDLHIHTHEERAKISVYLNNLIKLGIVAKDSYLRANYYITNPLIKFYYRFIHPNLSFFFNREPRHLYENLLKPFLLDYMEDTFKEVALEYLHFQDSLDIFPIKIKEVNKYEQNGAIIDYILKSATNEYVFVNCFYQDRPLGLDSYYVLNSRALNINKDESKNFYFLISRAGFDNDLKAQAQEAYMKLSKFYFTTLKENPQDADVISHSLLVRAGMIQKVASGFYSFMPFGTLVLSNIEKIIREEMNKIDVQELRMPLLQPAELWQESGRYAVMKETMVRFTDRLKREYIFSPTAEELVVDIVRQRLLSYKTLPFNLYQIQTKVRDEIRPRFGLMRSKEFIMKDGYSFHVDEEDAKKEFLKMKDAYCRILTRLNLKFRAVEADSGDMGGNNSVEFQVIADSGEDELVYCDHCQYGANVERAETIFADVEVKNKERKEVFTPNVKSIEEVSKFFDVSNREIVKTIMYCDAQNNLYAILIRGDLEINEVKLKNHIGKELFLLKDFSNTGVIAGFVGPVGLKNAKIIADYSVKSLKEMIVGANKVDHHLTGVTLENFAVDNFFDLVKVAVGHSCPKCQKSLQVARGIEVGHIFILGTKYSNSMNLKYKNNEGELLPIVMGCYGLGVTRLMAAIIEQKHDQNGIIWPKEIAPFKVVIIPANNNYLAQAEDLYQKMKFNNISVCIDDRDERLGFKLKDSELIGFPLRIILGQKMSENLLEVKEREEKDAKYISLNEIEEFVRNF
ncbi:mitochondrial ribosome protein l39/prolyl-trna ligase family member [Holotrichia oblita]|nr:mitochondrial ribosome protein l39/prolyl-trna ligase family member [Holotrichia oblita]